MKVLRIFSQIEPHIFNKYLIIFGFSIIGALINFFFFRQVYLNIGEDSFYYYAYSRRVISFLSPVLLLGIGISLPRAIGHFSQDKSKTMRLFMVSLITLSLVSLLWLLLNIFCNKWFTGLIWGEITPLAQKLNIAISVYLMSINISAGIHSYFRGKIDALTAGIIDLMAQAILPLVAFLLISDLVVIFYSISIMVFSLNLLVIFLIIRKFSFIELKRNLLLKETGELLGYGIRRIPGDIFYALLIFLPAYFAGSYFNIRLAGVFSFGLSLLTLFNLPATAISFVTLSRSASLLIYEKEKLRKETEYLLIIGVCYSAFIMVLSYLFLDKFLHLFFDEEFVKHSQTLIRILWALPLLVVFTILRSLTDSAYKRPYNSFFIFIALLILGAFSIFAVQNSNSVILIYGNIISYFALALLSLVLVNKTLRR
ncbi:hypothetical protein ES705_35490 [subsurface metagenome]